MKNTILVVDDEWAMRNLIKMHLSDYYEVIEAENGFDALTMIEDSRIGLIILDVMMPDMNGWEACENIRYISQTPILMLTARNDVKDRVRGLEIGADDYLTKPFAPEELLARVNALFRRASNLEEVEVETNGDMPVFNDMVINQDLKEIFVNQVLVDLTYKEFDLFYLLACNPKKVFSREELLTQAWNGSDTRDLRTIDTHIKNIREKFRKSDLNYNPIKTVWGVGYRFFRPADSK